MKPTSQPHDPLDELLAAAVHGELTSAQQAELNALLQHDPAARAAYQEIQTMHDLLENNHREVKPDPNFEDRMISGVRRKVREKSQRETAWESAMVLWRGLRAFWGRPTWKSYAGALAIILILAGVGFDGIKRGEMPAMFGLLRESDRFPRTMRAPGMEQIKGSNTYTGGPTVTAGGLALATTNSQDADNESTPPAQAQFQPHLEPGPSVSDKPTDLRDAIRRYSYTEPAKKGVTLSGYVDTGYTYQFAGRQQQGKAGVPASASSASPSSPASPLPSGTAHAAPSSTDMAMDGLRMQSVKDISDEKPLVYHAPEAPAAPDSTASSDTVSASRDKPASSAQASATPEPSRKLVRDATLDLEVKAYQPTVDTITQLAQADGGYLDSSSSQRGGNGKLQGTVVAKVAPEKLDAFLLKLRELGTLKNQSVSTEDVTKDYYDMQARLGTSRQMEAQLQELLKRDTSKVADLLQVERELGRVRGQIEQMQGQLKLYDFQVQYATVTISVAEKDLNKAAAYLLQEHDQFALFVHDVESAFAQAKAAADTYKAQILNADLEHESDNTMSATLAFSVPPDQVDAFLTKMKALGRVDNFTRTTTRVANDGGESDEPADETRTDKDRAQVQLTIHADDESPRQQTQLTIASTSDIDTQAQQLKDNAAAAGAAVTASSFERETDGTETATISFRLPLAKVADLMPRLEKLGRVESLAVHRDDQPGQAVADANAPAEIDLRLHNVAASRIEDAPPREETQLAVVSTGNVDAQAQQVKSDALKAGVSVTGSTFSRSPDGTEQAALTFRLPLAQAADFTAALEKLGKVESLAIQRNDVTGPNSIDPNAPAEIDLTLHNEPAIVAENHGFWPTMRHLLGGGVTAFLHSVETVGVLAAFLAPWLAALAVIAFAARRVWVIRQPARAR